MRMVATRKLVSLPRRGVRLGVTLWITMLHTVCIPFHMFPSKRDLPYTSTLSDAQWQPSLHNNFQQQQRRRSWMERSSMFSLWSGLRCRSVQFLSCQGCMVNILPALVCSRHGFRARRARDVRFYDPQSRHNRGVHRRHSLLSLPESVPQCPTRLISTQFQPLLSPCI